MINKDVIEKILKASATVSTRVITRTTSPLGFDAEIFFPLPSTTYGGADSSQKYASAPSLSRRVLISNLFAERTFSDISLDVFNDQQPHLWVEKEVRIPRYSKVVVKLKVNHVLQFKVDQEALMEGVDEALYHRYPLVAMSSVFTGSPEILTDISDLFLEDEKSGSLVVSVQGRAPLTYQWYKDGMEIPLSNSPSLPFINPQHSDVGMYKVRITNEVGYVESSEVRVYFAGVPVIATQLQGGSFKELSEATLSVAVQSHIPVTYYWYKDGERIYGESGNTLYFPSIREWHAGTYKVKVKSVTGEVDSDEAVVEVTK